MFELDGQKVVVLVFGMQGCGACDHYIPRLVSEVSQLHQQGYPFVVGGGSIPIPSGAIPVFLYDAASPDVDVQKLAHRFGVTATPTTIVACLGPGSFQLDGSLADNQIHWMLMMADEASKK